MVGGVGHLARMLRLTCDGHTTWPVTWRCLLVRPSTVVTGLTIVGLVVTTVVVLLTTVAFRRWSSWEFAPNWLGTRVLSARVEAKMLSLAERNGGRLPSITLRFRAR